MSVASRCSGTLSGDHRNPLGLPKLNPIPASYERIPSIILLLVSFAMGRPAWANDDQWTWLKSQATEYLKIKGKKTETAKFWPVFLDVWKERWPKPALTDVVQDDSNKANADASTADPSNEAGMEDVVAGADAGNEDQSVSKRGKKGKKGKKPLTVSVVRTTSSALGILY